MEKTSYGYDLDLLIILHKLCVSYPTRRGCRENSVYLSAKLLSLCQGKICEGGFSWILEIGRAYYESTSKVDEPKNSSLLLATPIFHL